MYPCLRWLAVVIILIVHLLINFTPVSASRIETQPLASGSWVEAWSPDGRFIAFGSDWAGEDDIWLMKPDGTDLVNLTADLSGDCYHVSWSPDGRRIAFASGDLATNSDIWVIETNGANLRNLTTEMLSDESRPAWSPDGQLIAFVSTGGEPGGYFSSGQMTEYGQTNFQKRFSLSNFFEMRAVPPEYVWVMNAADGQEKRQLSPPIWSSYFVPGWLSDSETIIYESEDQIWKVTVDGQAATALVAGSPYQASSVNVSAANDKIAFSNLSEKDLEEIWIMNSDGSELTNLTPREQSIAPVWSPDGRFIAFRSFQTDEYDILIMESDGANKINLSDGVDGIAFLPSWSPDGTQIAFSVSLDGSDVWSDIWVINSDGSNLTKLTGEDQ